MRPETPSSGARRARRDLPRLGRRERRRVASLVLLEQAEVLDVLEHVERVVRAGAVGAEGDADPAPLHRRVVEDAPHRQLEVRDGVGDHGRAALGDQVELGVVEPHGVREHGSRPQRSGAVEVGGWALAVVAKAVAHLALGLGEMDLDRDVELRAALGDPAKRVLGDRVDRVRGEGAVDAVDAVQLVEALERVLAKPAAPHVAGVDQRRPDRRSQPRVGHRPRGRRGLPVHVPEAHRPAADHLDARQPRPPVDVVGVELGLGGPDLGLQPVHQRQVVAVAAKERHRRVRVGVDEARDERHTRPVDDLVRALDGDVLADRRDEAVLGAQHDGAAVERRSLDGEAHPAPESGGTAPASASRTRSRLVRRPVSNSSRVRAAGPTPLARLSTAHTAA